MEWSGNKVGPGKKVNFAKRYPGPVNITNPYPLDDRLVIGSLTGLTNTSILAAYPGIMVSVEEENYDVYRWNGTDQTNISNWIKIGEGNNYVPTGGTEGQVLSKIDSTDYNLEWVDIQSVSGGTNYIPSGGTEGQILSKIDDTDYNLEWIDNAPTDLTTFDITHSGQVLKNVLDDLTGDILGSCRLTLTRDDIPYENIDVYLRDSGNTIISSNTTNSSGVVDFTANSGEYTIELNLLTGLIIESYSIDDIDGTNNGLISYTVIGVDFNPSGQTTVNVNVTDFESPTLNSMTINDGDSIASNPNLVITVDYEGTPTHYMISTVSNFAGASWISYNGGNINYYKEYISDTTLTLYLKLKNSKGESSTVSDDIFLQNGVIRSDSGTTYNTIDDALNDIISDYSGNLTQDVTISLVGNVLNTRNDSPYGIEIENLNLESEYLLTIDGSDKLTFDCESLGAFRIKNSRNIHFKNIDFINVGSEKNSASPDELAAINIQGIISEQCDNIIIENCNIDGLEVDKSGNYGILAKYVKNITIINNNITNFRAIPVNVKNCGSVSIIKNYITGEQTTGIVGAPCLLLASSCDYVNISDNELEGDSTEISYRRFDGGIIVSSPRINIERNKIHGIDGKCIDISSVSKGKYANIIGNLFYNNLLLSPYPWEKNDILFSSDFELINFRNNSVEMNGVSTNQYYESLIRAYDCTIDKLESFNNVIYMNFYNFTDNSAAGTVYYIDNLLDVESDYNYYIDKVNFVDGIYEVQNRLYDTSSDSQIRMNQVESLSELNSSFNIENNSQLIDYGNSIFTTNLQINNTYSSVIIAGDTGNTFDIDYNIKNQYNNAGCYFYSGLTYDETLDTGSTFNIENIRNGDIISSEETITMNSSDRLLLTSSNTNRNLIGKINLTSSSGTTNNYYGKNIISTVYSVLDGNGDYMSGNTYSINNITGTTYDDIIIVNQQLPEADFYISNYFPLSGSSISITNTSIANDTNSWLLDNGSDTPYTVTLESTSMDVKDIGSHPQILTVNNTVSGDTKTKYIHPIHEMEEVYFDIETTHEVARTDEEVTITLNKLNTVSGVTTDYFIYVYNRVTDTLVTGVTGDTLSYTFTDTGIYDVEAISNTNDLIVEQRKELFITITPALSDRGESYDITVPKIDESNPYFYTADGSSIPSGSTVVLSLDPTSGSTDEFRLNIQNFVGTEENPIVITIDETEQMQFYYKSYWGIQFYQCEHVVFDGRGYQNLEYGIHVTRHEEQDNASVAITIGKLCTDIQVHSVEISLVTFAGMQAKTDPKGDHPEYWRQNYTFYNFWLHHMYFHDTFNEGIYIGYFNNATLSGTDASGNTVTYRAHALENCKIYRNIFYNNGWDALQANNLTGDSEIAYNDLHYSALYPEKDQATFMSIGLEGKVHNNRMVDSGGIGIQYFPLGDLDIYNNVIDDVAYGSIGMLLMTSDDCPDQSPYLGELNIYNNTIFAEGTWMTAQNVVQITNVNFKNNLMKYTGKLYSGQAGDTIDIWEANSVNNYRVTDDGSTYKIADIDYNNYNIGILSSLAKGGERYGYLYDIRGYKHWYNVEKFIGAYSGYRRQRSNVITLSTMEINSGDSETTSKDLSISFTYIGNPAYYRIGQDSDLSGYTWLEFSGTTIDYELSASTSGNITVYLQIRTSDINVVSDTLSDTIYYNADKTYLIDFGRDVNGYSPGDELPITRSWNLMEVSSTSNPVPTGTTANFAITPESGSEIPITNLIDTDGNTSSIVVTVTQPFTNMQYQGGSQYATSADTMAYEWEAVRDQFYVNSPDVGELTISGLNDSKLYNIKCFGSRKYSSYETNYTVNGTTTQPLDCENNISNTADFFNISPSSGIITILVEESDVMGTINVLEIIELGS